MTGDSTKRKHKGFDSQLITASASSSSPPITKTKLIALVAPSQQGDEYTGDGDCSTAAIPLAVDDVIKTGNLGNIVLIRL